MIQSFEIIGSPIYSSFFHIKSLIQTQFKKKKNSTHTVNNGIGVFILSFIQQSQLAQMKKKNEKLKKDKKAANHRRIFRLPHVSDSSTILSLSLSLSLPSFLPPYFKPISTWIQSILYIISHSIWMVTNQEIVWPFFSNPSSFSL